LLRAWERLHPISRKKLSPESVTEALVSKPIDSPFAVESISFEMHPDANPASRLAGLKRFQVRAAFENY
jgi:hypothetical protein